MSEEKESTHQTVIIAPHPDDEIIGCYEVLCDMSKSITIVYSGEANIERKQEAMTLRKYKENVKGQMFQNSLPMPLLSIPKENVTFYFPDPINEIHPAHRGWGFIGESLAREGRDIIFYTTLMNVPYIHEVEQTTLKEALLNSVYPSQKSLWEYEKKYILFEGRCKWIF